MGFVPPLYPYFIKTVGLSTGLSSIKMNMICGERSSYGGLLFVIKKCRFECRLSVGLFIWNCCICSREMEVDKYEHYDAPKCYQNVPNCY